MKIKLKNARLAFPVLFNASAVKAGDKPAFSATFIIPKDHPQLPEIHAAMVAVAESQWKDKAETTLKSLKSQDRLCIHDGDNKADYAGYEGNYYINARSPKKRPEIRDADGKTPLVESDGRPYAGCYVTGIIDIYAQDSQQYGKRINASLLGVQFTRDGEQFASGSSATDDDFEDLSTGAVDDLF